MATMASFFALLMAFVLGFSVAEGRQGWKTYGNGFFIYRSTTDFHSTNQFNVNGVFSTMPDPTNKFTLLAVYDSENVFTFQLVIKDGMLTVAYPAEGVTETKDWSSPLINTGYAFSFSVSVKAQGLNASGSAYSINASVTGALRPSVTLVPFGRKWNYGNVTIKVGGNGPLDPIGAPFFRGCLSDVTFKGVDIIKEYFKQYPNNTNPTRGKEMFIRDGHSFSNVSQICDDVMSTAKPTSTDATKSKTTVTSASANLSSTKATSVPQTTKVPKTPPKNDASILTVTAITIFLSISFECLVTWLQHLT
ncbi:uncharacterized protein LOC135688293 isoform X2 [Rhopilema esculentum]|uniref:uncharacterized protein LOC135688293 isoform X2 n=1 Tax=Rhopilema esculentum TaxID=499914 RepID=UPI0031D8C3A4|eukprot:gene7204-12877_t